MRENRVIIVFLIFSIILNCKVIMVQSLKVPNYDYVETLEFQIPAFHNETVIFSDYVDLTLFDISDHSLTFMYYTVGLSDVFYINNVELIRVEQKIQYIDEIHLNSSIIITLKSGSTFGGHIYLNYSSIPRITNKELYNSNNYSITILLDVEIIHDYSFIEDPSLLLIVLFSFEIVGFVIVLILIGKNKNRK